MRRRDLRGPLITFAACVVVAFFAVAWYAVHRQQLADRRYDRQRDAICKVLASLPGQHPFPTLDRLRAVEARPGHPRDCQPPLSPTPGATPTTTATPAVVVFPVPMPQPAAASPAPSRTASPRPTPTRSPPRSPSPSPTPCTVPDVIQHPTHCLHL